MTHERLKHDVRILLVEDHPFQLKATQYLLESDGFDQVTATDSAQKALQLMSETHPPFDILLCDQCLPDLCGLDLIGIASHQGLIHHAIILSSLTSIELDALAKSARERELPLLGYLTKPLIHAEFKQLLNASNTINNQD